MSGYRQHGFDPNAFERPGRPLRPFNWVQWCGVALGVAGMALYLVDLAGRIGWIAPLSNTPIVGIGMLIGGSVLINSRRSPSTLITPEQQARNKRTLIIVTAVCVAILGVATVIEFTGAN